MSRYSIAYSPCPNDTFIFDAMVHQKTSSLQWDVELHDIEHLNEAALQKRPDVCKVSFGCLGHLLDDYVLLPVGAALGHNCGPQIVCAQNTQATAERPRIAIPGEHTTARLLAHALLPQPWEEVFCLYHEIPELLRTGKVDMGLIIHETRFALKRESLQLLYDLGSLWEKHMNAPIPLGGIVAKRSLGDKVIADIVGEITSSLEYARQYPMESVNYTLEHSIEKDRKVIHQHIALYVNEESDLLSQNGMEAIDQLLATWAQLHNKQKPKKEQWLWTSCEKNA